MQAATDRCFHGLSVPDLPKDLWLMCTGTVSPPEALGELWFRVDALSGQRLRLEPNETVFRHCALMVVVCDVFDHSQVSHIVRMMDCLSVGEVAPPMVLLPIRLDLPEYRGMTVRQALQAQDALSIYTDSVIVGEPSGFALALALHACVAAAERSIDRVGQELRKRTSMSESLQRLRADGDFMMWRYIPIRFRIPLPPTDYDLGDHYFQQFAGYSIGKRLAFGADEMLFQIKPPPGVALLPEGEMVKIIPKDLVHRTVGALHRIHRTWEILQTLSGRWSHPNIAGSLQLYNSPTCMYIRMQLAGTESLYARLKGRAAGTRTLSASHVLSVIRQLAKVVHHLHTGPHICHRDIKPDNLVLSETSDGGVCMKLVCFDAADVQMPGSSCTLKVGTFPFVAPEVADRSYDGMAADMWSVGVLIVEVACGVGVVERTVSAVTGVVPAASTQYFPRRAIQDVCEVFSRQERVHQLFAARSVPEVRGQLPWFRATVLQLIRAQPTLRWTCEDLLEALQALTDTTRRHRRRRSAWEVEPGGAARR